jgi:hypothetical protein
MTMKTTRSGHHLPTELSISKAPVSGVTVWQLTHCRTQGNAESVR